MKCVLSCLFLLGVVVTAQRKAPESPAIPMPSDRVKDSYAIYSSLLPLGETASPNWPHEVFLVRATTVTLIAEDEPCEPKTSSSNSFGFHLNPHVAVRPPDSNAKDYQEILRDFDAHCHERIVLSPAGWRTSAPVRLLTPAEQEEYTKTRESSQEHNPKFKGAGTLNSFSQVYFNANHTVALVYATHVCGGLCGQGFWIALALRDGAWHTLRWSSMLWIS